MTEFVGYMFNRSKKRTENEKQQLGNEMIKIIHKESGHSGFYIDDSIRLACQSLNRMTSDQNHQPMSYENERYWMVFDGEIYNYLDLRDQLKMKGYRFKTDTDTEVILALYADKKEELLLDLRGIFSFLIWDKKKEEVFGARDSFGSKAFYYIEEERALCFSSNIQHLYRLEEEALNLESLHYYFNFQYVPEPHTMQQEIHKLEAGHYFYKKPGKDIQMTPFSSLEFKPKTSSLKKEAAKIQKVLRESVHLHMESEGSVGAFLSGGVDSSAIVAFAKEKDPDIPTFTVGFEREGYSEIDVAKQTAKELDVNHYHYEINVQEFIDLLPEVIQYMGEPVADPSAVPLYIAAREAKKHVEVVLSGEGADELFGGYNIYREPKSLKVFDYIPEFIQTILKKTVSYFPKGILGRSFVERGTTALENRFIGNAKIFDEAEKKALLTDYQAKYNYKNITKPLYDEIPQYSDVHKMQYIDLHTWARGDILVKASEMSKAHGLALRSPFFDKKVFDVASKISSKLTVTKNTTKYVLREALEGVVPDSVLYNKKLGFPVPINYWLKNDLANWARELIQNSSIDSLINKAYVLDLLDAHQANDFDYSRKIWAVLVFIIWHEQVFLGAADTKNIEMA